MDQPAHSFENRHRTKLVALASQIFAILLLGFSVAFAAEPVAESRPEAAAKPDAAPEPAKQTAASVTNSSITQSNTILKDSVAAKAGPVSSKEETVISKDPKQLALTGPNSATAPVAPTNHVETAQAKTNETDLAEPPQPAAAELGELPVPSSIKEAANTSKEDRLKEVQVQFELAREQRRDKDYAAANQVLIGIMKTDIPVELKRKALFELALVAQDEGKLVKAQQIFAQYIYLYGKDPSVPEVLLRQGLIYRQMGVNTLAISKFYAVMSTALKLKLDNMEYYQKLVLQAQVEIADTFYMDGNYDDAADLYNRLLRANSQELDREQIHFKLVRSLSFRANSSDMIARAQSFLQVYPTSTDVPEVRFLLASTLKKIGRNQDSMKQVLQLLQGQEGNAKNNPEIWIYWQQRAGNEIAAQLYKEGDYLSSLQIYQNLATLDKTPEWQLPVWYQIALVFEQLQQPLKAIETYGKIMDRKKDLKPESTTPSLESLLEMSRWRKDYLTWIEKAKATNLSLQPNLTNTVTTTDSPTQ